MWELPGTSREPERLGPDKLPEAIPTSAHRSAPRSQTAKKCKTPRSGPREAPGNSQSLALDREKLQAIPRASLWIAKSSRPLPGKCSASRDAPGGSRSLSLDRDKFQAIPTARLRSIAIVVQGRRSAGWQVGQPDSEKNQFANINGVSMDISL